MPTDNHPHSFLHFSPHTRSLPLAPASSFGTPEEYQSFQFFLEKTSDLISVYSHPYLWTVLLPQATWHHSSIKHSVIALASLHQSLTTSGATSQEASNKFMFHYNTAIRALVADKPPIDIVLAACVIFWALENFNGSGQSAFDHMKAAIKILGEWKSKRRPNNPTDDLISKYIEPTIRDGFKFALTRQTDELVGQMGALSLTTRDVRVMSINYPVFDNLEDAERYLGDCIDKILNLKSRTQTQIQVHKRDRAALVEEIETLDARLDKWMHLFQTLTGTGPILIRRMLIVHNVAANILLDQLKAQAGYHALADDINISSEQARRSPSIGDQDYDSPERAGRCRFNFIVLEVEDMLLPSTQTSTSTMRENVRSMSGSAGSINQGLSPAILGSIAPIFMVATSSTKLQTRRRAVRALRLLNMSEGPWTSAHATGIAEAMLDIAQACAVPQTMVNLQHMHFEYDEESEELHIEWKPGGDAASLLNVSSAMRSIDVSGMGWSLMVSLDLSDLFCHPFMFSLKKKTTLTTWNRICLN